MGPVQRADAGQLESALMSGDRRRPGRRRSGSRRSTAEPSSISFFQGNDLSSVDDVDLAAGQLATGLRAARRRGQLRGQGQRRPAAARPARRRKAEALACTGSGSRSRSRLALLVRARPGRAACATPAWCARTTAARTLAFPLGAVLATAALVALAPLAFLDDRADLDLLDPELRRWLPYLLGDRLPRLPRRRARAGARRRTRRAAGAGTARALREGRLSTGAIKAIGALALAAYVVSGRGLEDVALPRRRRAADPRHQPLQPARPAAGAGGEGAGAARGRALPRRLDPGADRAARDLRRRRSWSAPGSPCASGRCSATPAPT